MLTSNRWVDRKNVVLELYFPFLTLENWRAIPFGDPYRDSSRTLHEDAAAAAHNASAEVRQAKLREIVEAVATDSTEADTSLAA
jgi:hypothetical protein